MTQREHLQEVLAQQIKMHDYFSFEYRAATNDRKKALMDKIAREYEQRVLNTMFLLDWCTEKPVDENFTVPEPVPTHVSFAGIRRPDKR